MLWKITLSEKQCIQKLQLSENFGTFIFKLPQFPRQGLLKIVIDIIITKEDFFLPN